MKARIHYNIATDRIEFWFYEETVNGERRVVMPVGDLVVTRVDPGIAVEPTFWLPAYSAKGLLESLASEIRDIGVKPKDESHLAGHIEATERHLEDVRKWFDLALRKKLGL